MTTVNAYYYDGISARRQAVSLSIVDGWLVIRGEEVAREETFNTAHISEKLGSAPRLIHFEDGAHCEITDHAAFEALLQQAGLRTRSFVSHLEGGWLYAIAALLLIISFGIATFLWGLPWVAEQAAARIPYATGHIIDVQALRTFDEGLMQASTLTTARQQSLQKRYDKLRSGLHLPPYPLEFRSSKSIGANAFALPGGTIVVTDELVKLASNDDEIMAVLAHELGHVSERHPLRQLLQGSVVALAMTWYLGDISSLLAVAPTLLLQANYSRNFERSADHFAAELLREHGINATRLADILAKLEATHEAGHHSGKSQSDLSDFLSSHPNTDERIRSLREPNAR
jgi:Zn-dependent protease with chaperone function